METGNRKELLHAVRENYLGGEYPASGEVMIRCRARFEKGGRHVVPVDSTGGYCDTKDPDTILFNLVHLS